ncbi:unnamed protein product [Didymodactylos carnosus]|uniref:Uncharacterized protein n=1 Tax=Didymodactylos carnosus TaxID=1234261 RepID=A0A814UJH2_9BILA|nr:unnamed protein product [Didymodactylos carnosus]CAF3939531.1 unnamed protein product [Didymodactylos carnosus]
MFCSLGVIKSSYSSALTPNSNTFLRPGGSAVTYYFVVNQVTASTSDSYTFVADIGIDTYDCLNRSNPSSKLIACNDNGASGRNFMLETLMAGQTVILVVTTFSALETAPFNVTVYGPGSVTFTGITMAIALKSMSDGKFVTAEDAGNGPLIARGDVINGWERFELIRLDGGKIAL